MKPAPEQMDHTRRWLRVEDAAKHAGYAVGAFMAMVQDGEVPSRLNAYGITFLYVDELDAWLAAPERVNHRDHRLEKR